MHETQGWLLDARTALVVLSVFGIAVLVYAVWRSRGEAKPDAIRESGPIL